MKLGLLQCDEVRPEFLSVDGDFCDKVAAMLGESRHEFELVTYRAYLGELPGSADACDAYLGGGSRYSVFEEKEWIQRLVDFVRELHAKRKKFVGICFCHQVIAHALGGQVERSTRGWGLGCKEVTISGSAPWMNPPRNQCRMLFTHQDQVTHLPEDAKLLGGSDHCPNGIFSMGDHFLALQSHPEYTLEYVRPLMESFREIIPGEVMEAGLATMENPPDNEALASWVRHFLLGP